MPTVFQSGGFRFFFNSNNGGERAHVHINGVRPGVAKVWLEPTVSMAAHGHYTPAETRRIMRLAKERREEIIAKWRRHFGR